MSSFEDFDRLLRYDAGSGELIWRVRTCAQRPAGCVAGSVSPTGYINVKVAGRTYRAHRVAWLLYHGTWPTDQLDHVNGCRTDNRLSNLRECSNAKNSQNQCVRSDNRSGFMGANWHSSAGRWQAQIMLNGKKRHLGLFDTPEDAHDAYLAAKAELHTFNPVPREIKP